MVTANDFLPPSAVEAEEEFDPYVRTALEFEEAAVQLDLEGGVIQRLRHPECELTVHLPIVLDSGQATTFTAFRVQHSTIRGPAMGAVLLGGDKYLSQIKAAAMAATWQSALLDIPFGGGAGAIVCDPGKLSERDLRALVKGYVYALRDFVGPFRDILTPAAGSSDRVMGWMSDAFAQLHGHARRGGITGKPPVLGGLPRSFDSVGRGLFFLLEKVLAERNSSVGAQRIAILGFDDVGVAAASFLSQAGARIIAISDRSGGLYNERGLDIESLRTFARQNGMLFGYPEAEAISNEELLRARCDVLIPSAAERQINAQNAAQIQAAIVLEATESPTTPCAYKILQTRGVLVVPEILGNAGAAVASFLEWTENVRYFALSPDERDERLKVLLQNAYDQVAAAARRYTTTLRRAAHLLAVDRVAAALRLG